MTAELSRKYADFLEGKQQCEDMEEAMCIEQYTNYEYSMIEFGEKFYIVTAKEAKEFAAIAA